MHALHALQLHSAAASEDISTLQVTGQLGHSVAPAKAEHRHTVQSLLHLLPALHNVREPGLPMAEPGMRQFGSFDNKHDRTLAYNKPVLRFLRAGCI
jgi:hypothetical protein